MVNDGRGREDSGGTAPEERVGDEVAKPSRRGRTASGDFKPRGKRQRTARTTKRTTTPAGEFSGEQRLLILDCWLRSKLPATDFSPLVGVTTATL